MRAALGLLALAGCILPVGVGPLPDGSSTGGGTTLARTTDDPSASASMTGTVAPDLGGPVTDPVGLAIPYETFVATDDSGGTDVGSSFGGSGAVDMPVPGTLVVQVGNVAIGCEDPTAALPCDNRWRMRFQLGPDELFAGASGELADHAGNVEISAQIVPDECAGGAGGLSGKFEVLAIDAAAIEVRLTSIEPVDGYPADVTFVAKRC